MMNSVLKGEINANWKLWKKHRKRNRFTLELCCKHSRRVKRNGVELNNFHIDSLIVCSGIWRKSVFIIKLNKFHETMDKNTKTYTPSQEFYHVATLIVLHLKRYIFVRWEFKHRLISQKPYETCCATWFLCHVSLLTFFVAKIRQQADIQRCSSIELFFFSSAMKGRPTTKRSGNKKTRITWTELIAYKRRNKYLIHAHRWGFSDFFFFWFCWFWNVNLHYSGISAKFIDSYI